MMNILHHEEQDCKIIERVRREADLPFTVVKMLIDRPSRGEGLHQWIYSPAARQLHAHLTPRSITGLLSLLCPEAEEREILDAVVHAAETAWQPSKTKWTPASLAWLEAYAPQHAQHGVTPRVACGVRTHSPSVPKWPLPDLDEIERIAISGPPLADLQAMSPFNFTGSERYTAWLLQQLFPPDALLCLALDQKQALTQPLSVWLTRHVEAWQFIVPSPMTALTGLTVGADAHESYRSLTNTGERRFLAVECDFSEYAKDGKTETRYAGLIRRLRARSVSVADMCAAVVAHLAELLPLVMVVHSGGKSLHGWFYVADQHEADLLEFMRLAVQLGADYATWCKCQLVRLPDGTRTNGARQPVSYFNAEGVL